MSVTIYQDISLPLFDLHDFIYHNRYATEGDNRLPKIYTKTGDKGYFPTWLTVNMHIVLFYWKDI